MSRHDPKCSSWAPMVGASTGATPTTSISRAMTFDTASPSKRSRTIAIESTMPAAAVNPWTTRSAVNTSMDCTSSIAAEATVYTASATSSGRRRPNVSESDPISTCPAARPARDAVRVSCTAADVAPRSAVISGNAAR